MGEHPRAAESAGIPVNRYRWIAMVLNGVLGGIGGAYLVLVQLGVFTENMLSGRGYIALATVILGRYTSFGVFGAALLFGRGPTPLQIRLQTIGVEISPYLLAMLPYVITLAAMLGAIGKNSQPEGAEQALCQGHALTLKKRSPRRYLPVRGFLHVGAPFAREKKLCYDGADRRERNESISHRGRDGPDVWPECTDPALL